MTKAVDYDPSKNAVLWYVAFSPRATHLMPWWVRLFTRDNFQHCYAFRDYNGITLIVNHIAQGLLVDATNVKAVDCAKAIARDKGETIVLFASRLKPRYTPRGVQSCVSVVKALIGLAAWRVWTPQGLYQYLIDNGGVVIWAEKGVKSNRAKPSAAPSTCASRTNSRPKSS
jgi:hypothetical protein